MTSANFINMAGKRIGFLVITGRDKNCRAGETRWNYRCDCGKTGVRSGNGLRHSEVEACARNCRKLRLERRR